MVAGADADHFQAAREGMLATLRWHGIRDERVMAAMRAVPRHRFIPPAQRGEDAYGDHPSSIGHGQTISQPFIVAYMAQSLAVQPGDRVLEIGTGCGYQAAVLAELGAEVFTLERLAALATYARETLDACGYRQVQVRVGDGYHGWPEAAPFAGILVACAAPELPPALLAQLADGGRLILPLGVGEQRLVRLCRRGDQYERHDDLWVRFVPMVAGLP